MAKGIWESRPTAKAKGKRTLPRCACLLAGARRRTDAVAYRPALIPVAALQRTDGDLSGCPLGWSDYPCMAQWYY
ncbi:hypothetical protein DRM94_14395 [Aeromonas taiwanensis]|uniref:Uncharacterized protein n=1 Tax=Aeromonas taiwanensis TaxID=633417 RepID=A0A5F0K8L8_9GAMM|nr:hypothetical protein DRM93_14395 [Aeromonas taiwanensis]TFF74580.1 hypothetical protein DRM95_14735 [Aeromonas taiwanensis]TFF77692.1 hypothetical protein DRM94_14395 [Aeromonas taiwanensis]